MVSFSFELDSKFIANIATENVYEICTEERKTTFFKNKVNLNFLRPSRYFDSDRRFCVFVSLLTERVYNFHNISNWMVETRFKVIIFWRVWKFCVKKHNFSVSNLLLHWWVGYFRNGNIPLPLQIQLLQEKSCGGAECFVQKKFRRCIGDQPFFKRAHCYSMNTEGKVILGDAVSVSIFKVGFFLILVVAFCTKWTISRNSWHFFGIMSIEQFLLEFRVVMNWYNWWL